MIERGQIRVDPLTGERLTFLETAASSGGKRVVIELRADRGGRAPTRVHPIQWETFTVVSGRLGANVSGRTTEVRPGQTLGIAPGVPHSWWNAGDEELVVRCEISPALQVETLLELTHAATRGTRGQARSEQLVPRAA